jgi:hypothetical protein
MTPASCERGALCTPGIVGKKVSVEERQENNTQIIPVFYKTFPVSYSSQANQNQLAAG